MLSGKIFMATCMSPTEVKEFEKACKELQAEVLKRSGEVHGLLLKIQRRSFSPEGVLERLTSLEAKLKNISCILSEISKPNINWERCRDLMDSMAPDDAIVQCAAVQVKLHQQRCRDLVAFGKLVEFVSLVDASCSPIECLDQARASNIDVNERIVDGVLDRLVRDVVQGKKIKTQKLLDMRSICQMIATRKCIGESATKELHTLATSLSCLVEDTHDVLGIFRCHWQNTCDFTHLCRCVVKMVWPLGWSLVDSRVGVSDSGLN